MTWPLVSGLAEIRRDHDAEAVVAVGLALVRDAYAMNPALLPDATAEGDGEPADVDHA